MHQTKSQSIMITLLAAGAVTFGAAVVAETGKPTGGISVWSGVYTGA